MFNLPTEKKLSPAQDRQKLQNTTEKQYCQYWMLRLVVINYRKLPTSIYCLLKLYMLLKSARTVSRNFTWKKMSTLRLLHMVS